MLPVDISPVADRHDRHGAVIVIDLVDHSEVTAPCAVASCKVETERPADLVRVLSKTAVDELDARVGTLLR